MDAMEDDTVFSPSTESSPTRHNRRLKRSRNAKADVDDAPVSKLPAGDEASFLPESEERDGFNPTDGRLVLDLERSEGGESPMERSAALDKDANLDDGLDPLFGHVRRFEDSGDISIADETKAIAQGDSGKDDGGSSGCAEVVDGSAKNKSAKKRLSIDEEGHKSNKKRSSSAGSSRSEDADNSSRNRKTREKERKLYLEQLHAESQKLLRETRDASFKPATTTEKSISSVLEKIKRRRLEISKTCSIPNDIYSVPEDDIRPAVIVGSMANYSGGSKGTEDISENEEHIPKNDPQEDSDNRQRCDKTNVLSENDDELRVTNEEPILFTNDLDANSDPSDDTSSDEEHFDKENVDPRPDKPSSVNLYRKNDLAKPFVDEEAEEEDDSDHDLMRFQENDDEDEIDDNEEIDDLIATGYEEMPLDNDIRNELHQKWLKQQDAATTDKVLQHLNHGKYQRDQLLVDDEKDDEEPMEGSFEESPNDLLPANTIRQQSKKAKQMITQMFTDKNDAHISSDDEETERRLFCQRILLEQTEEKSSTLSPAEDDTSREVFGLIRKLNIATEPKRRPRSTAAASLDMLVTGGKSSFKPSFFGRTTNHSLTYSSKQGSTISRSFVFGRDDSSSRSSFSSSENTSDTSRQEQRKKGATAKSCNSQPKNAGPREKREAENSGASLFDILRRPSVHFDNQHRPQVSDLRSNLISGAEAAREFRAFKLTRKTSEKQVS